MRNRERQKKVQRAWYRENKEHMLQKQRDRRTELRRWLREEVLAGKTCAHCPENHIACFDFHHTDPSLKEFKIGEICERKFSKERVLKEIEKCEILCSNCHRKHHFEERVLAQR
jgi:hypothetical protein